MSRIVKWLRRNPTTVPFVILGAFVVFTLSRGETTRDQVSRITTIVHQATCGGGHSHANLAACHRLCPNLSTISNLRCTAVPKEVVAGNGSNPSGPAGGTGTPMRRVPGQKAPAPNPTTGPDNTVTSVPGTATTPSVGQGLGQAVDGLLGTSCSATGQLHTPVCLNH